jgi:hypothetical protein
MSDNTSMFEVLNPWAEADPVPLRGIVTRPDNLAGKRIGLFINSKIAAAPTQDAVEARLKLKYPDLKFSRFIRKENLSVAETADKDKFQEWINGVDAAILSAGD